MNRLAGRFTRVESRRRARKLVLGLLSDLPRKNYWTIAERAGDRTPDGMQHLLGRAKWDADQVRDDVRAYVVEHLHDDEAVLVVDETGDVKKGTDTVVLSGSTPAPRAGSRTPRSPSIWSTSAAAGTPRRSGNCTFRVPGPPTPTAAGLGDKTEFATKPELAARMVTRFLDAGHQAAWVAGDEVYGGNPRLRAALEERGTGYVLAVACSNVSTHNASARSTPPTQEKYPPHSVPQQALGGR